MGQDVEAVDVIDRDWLRRAALRYLERYATSEAHLARILKRKIARRYPDGGRADEIETAVATVLDGCRNLGLIDDPGYADLKVSSGRRKGLSARRLVGALQNKGIDRSAAEAAVVASDMDDRLAAVVFARRRRLGPWRREQTASNTQKELAALCRAGFSYGIAKEVVAMTMDEADVVLAGQR